MRRDEYLALLSDLEVEVQYFQAAADRVNQAHERLKHSPDDTLLWYSLAYLIHNMYNACETYFLRISKFFENTLPAEGWHRTLVDRMSVSVPDFRPAVLDREDREPFHELRAFRHLVRHLYDRDIDPVRVNAIYGHAHTAMDRFPAIHDRFQSNVRRMAELSDSGSGDRPTG